MSQPDVFVGEQFDCAIPLSGQIADSELLSYVGYVRRMVGEYDLDIVMVVIPPESKIGGGLVTRPYSRGGPSNFVHILCHREDEERVKRILGELLSA